MSSTDERVQRLERRMRSLNRAVSELQKENKELREEVEDVRSYKEHLGDRVDDLNEKLDGFTERFRQIEVNAYRIKDLEMRLRGKIGATDFETIEERMKQIRAQISLLSDHVSLDEWPIERHEELAQKAE